MTDQSVQVQISNLNHKLGVLEGRAESMEKRLISLEVRINEQLREQKQEIASLSDKLDEVLTVLNKAQGSWKTIGILGGIVAAVAGSVSWLISTIQSLGN